MKRSFGALTFILLLPTCAWFSENIKTIQGSGKRVKQERSISNVSELDAFGSGTIVLKQGDRESLVVAADENLLPHIITEVEDGELLIHPAPNTKLRSKSGITYHLIVKQLSDIKLSGAVELESRSLKGDEIEFDLSGAAKAKVRLFVDELEVEGAGSSKLYLEGRVNSQKIELSGSSHYDAGSLKSETAKIEVSGASRTTIAVSKQLEVEASGVAVVSYRGNPETEIDSSGAASVKKVG